MSDIKSNNYNSFDTLDGSHPFKDVVEDGHVDYEARSRKGAKIRYFNFDLAKEMGLLPKSHPNGLNNKLSEKILKTFSLMIINEYDIEHNRDFSKDKIKDAKFMATRYLQLQHDDKKGLSSGDGRSIWNGQFKNGKETWDITSCGTGGTRLSPATTKFNKFFENGDPSISYGCGFAEIDEGIAQALFSEVFYKNKIKTERTLLVLEFEKGYAINVRAHPSLLRPSHFFIHLKQGNYDNLKNLVDYYIDSQKHTKQWADCPGDKSKYDFFLKQMAINFGNMASVFENEYIFCWLDWDGDNILMDGSIIDYGSIRQFGMFHSEYRYDDVDRFSTSILEQRDKAKYIIQSFAQLVDYIKTKDKKNLKDFKNHKSLDLFDKEFEDEKNRNILKKIGLDDKEASTLIDQKIKLVKDFRKIYNYFERAKSSKGLIKVSDGISWDAIFCMRDIMREIPKIIIAKKEKISDRDFIDILKSHYATEEDIQISSYRSKMIKGFQDKYWDIITEVSLINKHSFDKQILKLSFRASKVNKFARVTGDSISLIVEQILKKKNSICADDLYEMIDDFSSVQSIYDDSRDADKLKHRDLLMKFFRIVKEHREGL